jgi:hypothetical protein
MFFTGGRHIATVEPVNGNSVFSIAPLVFVERNIII